MAPRAIWKGFLKIGELVCPVALYTAISASERTALHLLNRKTGHRLHRQFVDQETGKEVGREDQVKGYETAKGDYVVLEPEEIAAVLPESDKTLSVETFIPCDQVDDLYLDRPYYLLPAEKDAAKAYGVLREGLRKTGVVALAKAILFRRVHTVLIRAYEDGLIATVLNYDYEVRDADTAFADIPAHKLKKEMLDLAAHIIATKMGTFKPAENDDRYEAALRDLVQAKIEGREIKPPKEPRDDKVIDLMEALRQSATSKAATGKAASKGGKAAAGKKSVAKKAASKPKPTSKAAAKSAPKAAQRKVSQRKTAQRKAG